MSFAAFAELAKRAFVDAARHEFALPGRKASSSRVALLTGLTRKDVQRLSEETPSEGDDSSAQYNRAAKVIAGWVRDSAFQTGTGAPTDLPFDGGNKSFSELVRLYSGDVPPRAVLDELLRVGAVERGAEMADMLANLGGIGAGWLLASIGLRHWCRRVEALLGAGTA